MPNSRTRLIALGALLVAMFMTAAARSEPPAGPPAKTGGIAGRLTPPEGIQLPLKGFQLQASSQHDPARPQQPITGLAAADDAGRFAFADLPPGRYVIRPAAQQNVRFFVAATAPLEVRSGEILNDVVLTATPCREVRGRVVDRTTGQGIANVSVLVYSSEPARKFQHGQTAMTDGEGLFSAWLLPGSVRTTIRDVPVGYLPATFEKVEGGFVQRDYGDNPLIELQRAAVIEGIVVDESIRRCRPKVKPAPCGGH